MYLILAVDHCKRVDLPKTLFRGISKVMEPYLLYLPEPTGLITSADFVTYWAVQDFTPKFLFSIDVITCSFTPTNFILAKQLRESKIKLIIESIPLLLMGFFF